MGKKRLFLSFSVLISLLILCFFLFSSLIFSRELPDAKGPHPYTDFPATDERGEGEENRASDLEEKEKAEDIDENQPERLPSSEQSELFALSPSGSSRGDLSWDESIIAALSFLKSPIPGALVSSRDSHLPGAPRPYRHGVHEGLDYYSGYCGLELNFGDPVYAAGPGVIYRIDHNYQELSVEEREELLKICAETAGTPEDILDRLRGRQVWISHPHGVMTRYAHLSAVAPDLQIGDMVEAGTFIGNLGNSGTAEGAEEGTSNYHLHFEIWIGSSYLGEGLSPQETRELWQRLLEK